MVSSLILTCLSTLLWTSHYYLIKFLLHDKSAEFCNRLITLVHGSSVSLLGMNQCFNTDISPIYTPLEPTTNFQKFIMIYSLGYFLFDLGWCIYYQTETRLMIFHHLATIGSLWRVICRENSGGQVTCTVGALECTNPFLQARWFVRTYGYHKTPLFNTVEIVYVMLFLFIRICMGTFYIFIIFMYENPWEYVLMAVIMYVISWMFVSRILRYMNAKYRTILHQVHSGVRHEHEVISDVIPPHS